MTDLAKKNRTRVPGYVPKLSRRESLKWMGVLSGAAAVSMALPACTSPEGSTGHAPWPELSLAPVKAQGYGTDPNLITPALRPGRG